MRTYDHKKIEKKWQKEWEKAGLYKISDQKKGKKNFCLLVEYPYPSGNLHIGHWYAFAVPDIFARKKRMEGYNVLFPIGFDSFGLPAENAAIKHNLNPKEWTSGNIDYMTNQLKSMGNSFDWSRTLAASDPKYYKWTQWLFTELFKKGLAYRKKAEVNWCPSCNTVLANEQVADGRCDRCESEVVKKQLKQWFFKITDYAERLLKDLDSLEWPEEIKESQKNWIGRSEGVNIKNKVKGMDMEFEVYDSIPQTQAAQTFTIMAPEHPLVDELVRGTEHEKSVKDFVTKIKKKKATKKFNVDEDMEGVFTGRYVDNYLNTGRDLPIWVASYAVYEYGTGIVNCSAHDERDFKFAKKYGIPLHPVLFPSDPTLARKIKMCEVFYREPDGILEEPTEFKGRRWDEAREDIIDFLVKKGFATRKVNYKLRDWLLSRQRYWGTPIPIVYDPEGKPHPVPNEHLPWLLPEDVDFKPTGVSPLARSKELKERTEKIFGEGWKPEVDTMDTFVDSSWYFLRYFDSENEKEFCALEKQKKWMPINQYLGGAEHTTMHLLYSRFFYKALRDIGLVTANEPYKKRMNRGLVLGPDGRKMSKSKGNVVDPDRNVQFAGADSVKMCLAFIGPYNEVGAYPWSMGGIAGMRRFLERVWRLKEKVSNLKPKIADKIQTENTKLQTLLHRTIKKVGEDIEAFKFNTAISQMMICVNELEKQDKVSLEVYETLLKLVAPFAPHITEELWHELGRKKSIHLEKWPEFDEKKTKEPTVTIVFQVNGKIRSTANLARDSKEEEVKEKAFSDETLKKWINGKNIKKVVYVPGKLLNIVVG
ncbi:MAG: leucine--tRNA ligase [bacterium]|nr:leucine--tRNA ligase [bacterium]